MQIHRPTVYCVIPVHNRLEFTERCLAQLRNQTYSEVAVVVVDDGSSDGTRSHVLAHNPEVTVLEGDGNLWWAGATNMGVRHVLANAAAEDYILTLNNDTLFEPDFIANLVVAAGLRKRTLIGSVTKSAVEPGHVVDAGIRIDWKNAKFSQLTVGSTTQEVVEVDVLPGRGTLIPIEVFRTIGLFAERFLPQYGADYEFSWRAKRMGYALIVSPTCVIRSYVYETGLTNRIQRLTWIQVLKSLFDRRSPLQIRTRWHFARLCLGFPAGLRFLIFDLVRVIGGSFRAQLSSTESSHE